jgi:hypothetical protein
MFICISCRCVLSTFDCMLSVCFCYVYIYIYVLQLCDAHLLISRLHGYRFNFTCFYKRTTISLNKYHVYTTGLCFILTGSRVQLLINNLIDKYIYDKVSNNVDCRLLWDILKIEIREATIIYCKSKSKFKRESRPCTAYLSLY